MIMENLKTFLYASTIIEEPELKMDFREMLEREEFFKLLKIASMKEKESDNGRAEKRDRETSGYHPGGL